MSISKSSKPIYTLGLNENHDASAAIACNGKIICAIATERISGVKHDSHRIKEAVEYVLYATNLRLSNISAIASSFHGSLECNGIEEEKSFKEEIKESCKTYEWVKSHHLLHAVSATLLHNTSRAAIMICDGMGSPANALDSIGSHKKPPQGIIPCTGSGNQRFEAETHFSLSQRDFTPLKQYFTTHCPYVFNKEDIGLGRLYSYVSKRVFESINDAGKTMALASFGKPGIVETFIRKNRFSRFFDPDRLEVEFRKKETSSDVMLHANLARTVQDDLETTLLARAQDLRRESGLETLISAGGVFLNCPANTRILSESGFKNYHPFPAATDDGIALGAATYAYEFLLGGEPTEEKFSIYLGRTYKHGEIDDAIRKVTSLGAPITTNYFGDSFTLLCNHATDLLLDGATLAWFQGGSEFGPRALGNRSILASPLTLGIRDQINSKIKHREFFRPLAPIILEDFCAKFFLVEKDFSSPYMMFTLRVREKFRSVMQDVVHIDGTSRVQTVNQEQNSRISTLLEEHNRRTGIPLLLNTSLNGRGQPIIETPHDALDFFLNSPINAIAIGDFLVTKLSSLKEKE